MLVHLGQCHVVEGNRETRGVGKYVKEKQAKQDSTIFPTPTISAKHALLGSQVLRGLCAMHSPDLLLLFSHVPIKGLRASFPEYSTCHF